MSPFKVSLVSLFQLEFIHDGFKKYCFGLRVTTVVTTVVTTNADFVMLFLVPSLCMSDVVCASTLRIP